MAEPTPELYYKVTVEEVSPRGQDQNGYNRENSTTIYTQAVPAENFDIRNIVEAVNWPDGRHEDIVINEPRPGRPYEAATLPRRPLTDVDEAPAAVGKPGKNK